MILSAYNNLPYGIVLNWLGRRFHHKFFGNLAPTHLKNVDKSQFGLCSNRKWHNSFLRYRESKEAMVYNTVLSCESVIGVEIIISESREKLYISSGYGFLALN